MLTVQVTKTVSLVLDVLEQRDLLNIRHDDGADAVHPEAPKDNKAKVIAELLETERKYVQYLEILQVTNHPIDVVRAQIDQA